MLADEMSFSWQDLARVARNGFEVALVTDAWKAPHLAALDSID
jgi:adenosine deaminase